MSQPLRAIAKDDRPASSLDAFLRADYDLCIDLLSEERSIDGDFLLARALIRAGRLDDAETTIRASRGRRRATALTLRARILMLHRQFDEAESLLSVASQVARSPEEHAEIAYHAALNRFTSGDTDGAAEILDREEFGGVRALAEELRAWVRVRRLDYRGAIEHFANALVCASHDALLEANMLLALSGLAREIYAPEVMRTIERRAMKLPITKYTKNQIFHVRRASAWFAAIDGDFREALMRLRAASLLNTSDAWRVTLLCDRAYISLAFGEQVNGWDFAEIAVELANTVDWSTTSGDERMGLLYAASIVADRNSIDARRCWKRYVGLAPTDVMHEWSRDLRAKGWEEFTLGAIERAEGNVQAATAHFSNAFALYRRVGYDWRAVLTLIARGWTGLTDGGYTEFIEKTLSRYPNSWLRQLVERQAGIRSNPILSALTPMQREVLFGVLAGKKNRQIAEELGKSASTIRDHVTDIFVRTHCTSRAELIRHCADNGVI